MTEVEKVAAAVSFRSLTLYAHCDSCDRQWASTFTRFVSLLKLSGNMPTQVQRSIPLHIDGAREVEGGACLHGLRCRYIRHGRTRKSEALRAPEMQAVTRRIPNTLLLRVEPAVWTRLRSCLSWFGCLQPVSLRPDNWIRWRI